MWCKTLSSFVFDLLVEPFDDDDDTDDVDVAGDNATTALLFSSFIVDDLSVEVTATVASTFDDWVVVVAEVEDDVDVDAVVASLFEVESTVAFESSIFVASSVDEWLPDVVEVVVAIVAEVVVVVVVVEVVAFVDALLFGCCSGSSGMKSKYWTRS